MVYSGKSVFPSQHQSELWRITTGSQALRSGDWETFNHDWKGKTGELLFSFSKKKGSAEIT